MGFRVQMTGIGLWRWLASVCRRNRATLWLLVGTLLFAVIVGVAAVLVLAGALAG